MKDVDFELLVAKNINPLRDKMTIGFNNVVQKIDALIQR